MKDLGNTGYWPAASPHELKVAIVHYWIFGFGGGERVIETLAEMYPQADLFCLAADPSKMGDTLRGRKLTTSFLQSIPGCRRWYRHMLPLQPWALESLDLAGYDLVLSSESGPAKGAITHADTCHICYCHSPMRYLWDLYADYSRSFNPLVRSAFSLTSHYMRMWDVLAANRVDYFIANSHNVANRIRKHYRREAKVIYPPVDVAAGYLSEDISDYYLVVSRLIDYKRVDLAIRACNQLGRRLRVIGEGEQYRSLRKIAGPTVEFLGRVDDVTVRENYAHCRALLFPGEEDFGIVPVEAHSFGRPVIAFGKGGALETVAGLRIDESDLAGESTGIFFREQTPQSLIDAISSFESVESRFSPPFIRSTVEGFDTARFKSEMQEFISIRLQEFQNRGLPEKLSAKMAGASG
jgi:glycosyltransferase involved in cell wall biosynthesis